MILVDHVVFIIDAKRRGVIVRPAAPRRQLTHCSANASCREKCRTHTQILWKRARQRQSGHGNRRAWTSPPHTTKTFPRQSIDRRPLRRPTHDE